MNELLSSLNAAHRIDATLEQIIETAVSRYQDGQPINVEMLAAAHPEYAEQLRELLPMVSMMVQMGATASESQGLPPSPSPSPPSGGGIDLPQQQQQLGDFRIVREIGRGGMGVVYEAEQISLGRRIALKVLPFAAMLDRQQLTRFKNEARAAATLDHSNIVAIHSVGCERSVHFYAMQLIEGPSLAEIIASMKPDRPPSAEETALSAALANQPAAHDTVKAALSTVQATGSAAFLTNSPVMSREFYRGGARLGIQAAEGLDHAHRNGILHRDIKPANLLVDDTGKLWITDFGLARMEADAGMTMTGDLLGTLRYISPEQVDSKGIVVDHRCDIYSLGATLYELFTLEPAFAETDRAKLLQQIVLDEPRPLRKIDAHIPTDLETIVLTAMAKQREERYQTAQQLADDLAAFLENRPIKARPPAMWNRVAKWSRRHVAIVWAAVLILLATTVVSAVSGFLIINAYGRESAQRRRAEAEREHAEAERGQAEANLKKAREAVYAGLIHYGPRDPSAVAELIRVCDALMGMGAKQGKSDKEVGGELPPLAREKAKVELLALAREVAKRNPENVLNQYYLGLLLGQLRQYEEGIAVLREADRLQPDTPFILDKLAWRLTSCPDEKVRDPHAAVEFAKRAVKLAPQDGVYLNTLGVAQYRAGDWKPAFDALRKARELPGGAGDFNEFFLAMCYWRQGDHDAARKWYAKGVEQMEEIRILRPGFYTLTLPVRAETEQLLGYGQAKSLKVE